jgi:hypothetical protein
MSTKTTFKRVALVAVAALGLSLVAVTPSTAAVQSDTLTLGAATSTGVIGTAVTNTVSVSFIDTDSTSETATATVALLSSPSTSAALPTLAITTNQGTANTAGTTSAAGLVLSVASPSAGGRATGAGTISLTPTVAGTYVIRVTPAGGLTTTAQTWTVTVSAKPAITAYGTTVRMIPAYSNGSVDTMGNTYVNPYPTGATDTILSTHATLADSVSCYSDPTYAGSQCAIIEVAESNATATTSNTLTGADAADITVSISGAGGGTVSLAGGFAGSNPYGYFDYAASPKGVAVYEGSVTNTYARASLLKRISVNTTGLTGTSTVTIKAGDTVLGTKTVVFYGNASKISTATVVNSVIATGNSNAANVGAVTAYVYDALGNPVPGVTLYANSSDTTVISNASAVTSSTGKATFTLNGGIAGTATLSITNVAPLATTTALAGVNSVSVRVGSTTPASVSWALDATSYVPGALATLTVTLKDASGLAVVNGTYANIFAGASTSSLALASTGTLPTTGSVTTTGSTGSAAYTFNMPVAAGSVVIKNTTGTGVALANQAVAVSLTADVSGGVTQDAAQAATDAAAEATDAANAATDAANAAAEAADAATAAAQDAADAVAALSTQVAEMIDALKKQITALTNLVIKIQKKVKA